MGKTTVSSQFAKFRGIYRNGKSEYAGKNKKG